MALSALMLASCANEDLNGPAQDGPVVFSVQLPGEFTRAISDGSTATQLSYAVYLKGEDNVLFTSENTGDPQAAAFSGLKTSLSLNLAKGKEYDIIFWADKPGNSFYDFKPAAKSVEIKYDGIVSNDEDRDAFFQKETFKVTGAETRTVTLRRPFAQLNFATSDLEAANKAGLNFSKTQVTVSNVYNTLNLLTGVASNTATGDNAVTFAWNGLVNNDVVNGTTDTSKKYNWLSMNYLLTGAVPGTDIQTADSETVNCTFKVQDSNASKINTIEISNVPVQRNYRTNIYGALLTSTVDFNIEIEPTYNDPAHKGEYDEEGFRVANSLVEAKALLKDGEPAVSVLASLLTATRAAGDVEFLLNKTVPWQKLKVKGEATTGVKVSYDAVADGSTAVDKPKFTLIITNKVPSATFDLPDAAIEIKGKPEPGAEAAEVTAVTIENAASATVSGDTKVDEITTGDSFTGDVEFNDNVELTVNTAEDFLAAITKGAKTINVPAGTTLDLKEFGNIDLNNQNLIVNGTINTARAQIGVRGEGNVATVMGPGSITSEGLTGATGNRPLNAYDGGTLIVKNLNLSTEQNNGGSVIYSEYGNLDLENVKIDCHNFAIGATGGTLKANNCVFNSDSNNKEGAYSYTVNVISGCKAVLDNVEVNGIQGGVAVGNEGTLCIINSGKYTTHSHPDYPNVQTAFYPVYIFDHGVVEVNGGEFISGCNFTIFNGNNDVPSLYDYGNGANLKGGKYNKGTINQESKLAYPAAKGYKWVEITGDDVFKYKVVPESEPGDPVLP